MPGPRHVWITRAQPGADATAARVRALGHIPIVGPLLAVRPVQPPRFSLAGVGALAFTSGNAVRAFAELSPVRDLKVFAVGQATAAAARQAGFETVLSADGDVAALAAAISARRHLLAGEVLHAAPTEPAGDLAGDLAARGVPARAVAVYETVPAMDARDVAGRIVEADDVLLHSAKAARLLAELLKSNPAPRLRALAISPAALEPLRDTPLAGRAAAPLPLEAALLNLITVSHESG